MGEISKSICRNLDDELTETSDKSSCKQSKYMKVYLRVKPFMKDESFDSCLNIVNKETVMITAAKETTSYKYSHSIGKLTHQFTFSEVFDSKTEQEKLFSLAILKPLESFIEGEDCLIFSYGASNAGKTYTMQGLPSNPGLIPRSIDVLFNSLQNKLLETPLIKIAEFSKMKKLTNDQQLKELQLTDDLLKYASESDISSDTSGTMKTTASLFSENSDNSSCQSYDHCSSKINFEKFFMDLENRVQDGNRIYVDNKDAKYSIWISFAELYNENIYDLLEPLSSKRLKRRPILKLAEDRTGNVFIKGLKKLHVSSANEAIAILLAGKKNLRFAVTNLNHNSSRSHCIFTVELVKMSYFENNPHIAIVNRLSFCDLAGSERHTKTQNVGNRLKEGCSINTSLLVLGRCITALRDNQTSVNLKLIPFRESKLTRLFQSFFMKHSEILMIVNINPSSSMRDENLHVLKFSALAGEIVTNQNFEQSDIMQKTKISVLLTNDIVPRSPEILNCSNSIEHHPAVQEFLYSDKYNALLEFIKKLRDQVIIAYREKDQLEIKLREEFGKHCKEEILRVHDYYSEVLEDQAARHEDAAENRLQSYIDYMKKVGKRKENELEEKLLVEKKFTQDQSTTISELIIEKQLLKEELENVRETLKTLSTSYTEMQVFNANLQFELASLKEDKEIPNIDNMSAQRLSHVHMRLMEKEEENKTLASLLTEYEVKFQMEKEKQEVYELEMLDRRMLLEERDAEIQELQLEKVKQEERSEIPQENENNNELRNLIKNYFGTTNINSIEEKLKQHASCCSHEKLTGMVEGLLPDETNPEINNSVTSELTDTRTNHAVENLKTELQSSLAYQKEIEMENDTLKTNLQNVLIQLETFHKIMAICKEKYNIKDEEEFEKCASNFEKKVKELSQAKEKIASLEATCENFQEEIKKKERDLNFLQKKYQELKNHLKLYEEEVKSKNDLIGGFKKERLFVSEVFNVHSFDELCNELKKLKEVSEKLLSIESCAEELEKEKKFSAQLEQNVLDYKKIIEKQSKKHFEMECEYDELNEEVKSILNFTGCTSLMELKQEYKELMASVSEIKEAVLQTEGKENVNSVCDGEIRKRRKNPKNFKSKETCTEKRVTRSSMRNSAKEDSRTCTPFDLDTTTMGSTKKLFTQRNLPLDDSPL